MNQAVSCKTPPGRSGAAASLLAYIDFKSANSRLALGPTLALADEVGAAVDWRPLHLKPRRSKAAPAASRSGLHVRMRAEYRRREQALYAGNQGIELIHPPTEFDSFAANAGLLWMRRQGAAAGRCRAYVTQVFTETWAGRMDPADVNAVAAAIAAAGGEGDKGEGEKGEGEMGKGGKGEGKKALQAYLAGAAQAELDAVAAEARALGANDTPAFVVGGELYIGRQHLPVIRWWLTGQVGEPPV